MKKISILSLSLLTVMSGAAVAPAVADIVRAFPDSPKILGKMVLATPALAIIPVSLLTGYLSNKISRKTILAIGLFLYTIGGAGGGLANDITILLLMRIILGIGVGMIMPISMSTIADIYTGEEKIRTMGYAGAATNLGGVIATFLSGLLASLSWRASFTIYLLSIPVFILVMIFIPNNKPAEKSNAVKTDLSQIGGYLKWGAGVFLLMVAFFTIPINMSIYISEEGIGGSQITGLLIAFMNMIAFITGMFFGKIYKALGKWIPVLLMSSFAASFFLMASFPSIYITVISMIFAGIAMGVSMPYIMNGVTSLKNETNAAAGTAVVSSLLYAGQFASPILTDQLSLLTFGSGIKNIFLTLSVAIIVFMVITIFIKSIPAKRRVL